MKRKRKAVAPSPEAGPAVLNQTERSISRKHVFLTLLALVLLTLLAYSNSFSTGFALDNRGLLLEDTRIQNATTENIDLILHHTYWWPAGESGLYRPLTTLSYLWNYAILGNRDHPPGYHWVNFFLHAANVFLLFALMLRLLDGRDHALRTAFVIAMLWAVHPVLTESVTNIIGRADLLAGFAVLGGFLCYLESISATAWRRAAWLAGLAVAAAIGAFSKESAVVLPGVIVLYELVCRRNWRAMLPGLLATLVPIGIMLWQRESVLSAALPAEYPFLDNPIAGAGFWAGRLTAIAILARYLALAIWPLKLSADYSYAQIPVAHAGVVDWICWFTVAGSVAAVIFLWKNSRLAFFFAGFAFLNLLPASNLLFPIGTMMAERLLYLPLAGLIAAAILAISAASRISSTTILIFAALIAAGFAVRTWLRNFDWADDRTMARAGIEAAPRSYKFHRLLAAQLLAGDPAHRDVEGAVTEADRTVAILAPVADELNSPATWNLAAACHRVKGDTLSGDAARAQYEEAARLAQRSIDIDKTSRAAYDRLHGITSPIPASAADGYRTLASAYLHLDQPGPAIAAATEAQKIDPANVGGYQELAQAFVAEDRPEDAAIALAQGMFATSNQGLRTALLRLYQSGLDPKHCAVVPGPRGPALNPSCEIVVRDLCEAAKRANRPDLRAHLTCPN